MERTEKREILQMHAKYSEAALVVMPIITPILEFCVKCQRNDGFKTDTLDFFFPDVAFSVPISDDKRNILFVFKTYNLRFKRKMKRLQKL